MLNELYHITKLEFLDSIFSKGLIPNFEKIARFEFEEEDRRGIYMTSDYETILTSDSSFYNGIYAILKIDVSDIKSELIIDDAYDLEPEYYESGEVEHYSWYYQFEIPVSKIKFYKLVKSKTYSVIEL